MTVKLQPPNDLSIIAEEFGRRAPPPLRWL
jgi:hypothetical protein